MHEHPLPRGGRGVNERNRGREVPPQVLARVSVRGIVERQVHVGEPPRVVAGTLHGAIEHAPNPRASEEPRVARRSVVTKQQVTIEDLVAVRLPADAAAAADTISAATTRTGHHQLHTQCPGTRVCATMHLIYQHTHVMALSAVSLLSQTGLL